MGTLKIQNTVESVLQEIHAHDAFMELSPPPPLPQPIGKFLYAT
jgi:hypothetical protein